MPEPGRRRTEGLRREDVAAISGVSVSWYTWLEQGRAVHISDGVLERICRALKLSDVERTYLYSLVQHRLPPLIAGAAKLEVTPAMSRLLHALEIPALIMTARWDVVDWNKLAVAIFRDYAAIPPEARNLLRILFTDPVYQADSDEALQMAKRVVAKFRLDYGQAGGDQSFTELVAQLEAEIPLFHQAWRSKDVSVCSEGINRRLHCRYGALVFEHSSYGPEGSPQLRLLLFVPHDAATAACVANIRRDLAGSGTVVADQMQLMASHQGRNRASLRAQRVCRS
ncbi:MAG: helix-turn-helix domain-containing protein [Gammaproteobacteria bacterium]|nr:helix-turn-helix domain-containing protein [Gammaproteobacteria bacterium]